MPDLYYGGIAASLTESVLFGGTLTATVMSPHFVLSPLLLGYFGLVYGTFISIGLVFVDERSLWNNHPKHIGLLRKMIYCFLAAFVSYLAFAAWATLIDKLAIA